MLELICHREQNMASIKRDRHVWMSYLHRERHTCYCPCAYMYKLVKSVSQLLQANLWMYVYIYALLLGSFLHKLVGSN